MGKIGELERGLGISLGGQTFLCKHWAPPRSLTDAQEVVWDQNFISLLTKSG